MGQHNLQSSSPCWQQINESEEASARESKSTRKVAKQISTFKKPGYEKHTNKTTKNTQTTQWKQTSIEYLSKKEHHTARLKSFLAF